MCLERLIPKHEGRHCRNEGALKGEKRTFLIKLLYVALVIRISHVCT